MALTPEQKQKLIDAGYSASKIAAYEKTTGGPAPQKSGTVQNIKDAAAQSFQKQQQGFDMAANAQDVGDVAAGATKAVAGSVGLVFSPLTGWAKPLLDKATPYFEKAVDKLSNTKAFKEYGEGSVGTERDTATRTLDAVVDATEVAGGILGPKPTANLAIKGTQKVAPAVGVVASKSAQLPARGASEIQGALTGTSGETIRQAFGAARRGGKELDEFTAGLRGKTTPEQLVNRLREGTDLINSEKSARFGQMLDQIGDATVDTSKIRNEVVSDLERIGVKVDANGVLDFSQSKFRTVPQAANKLQEMWAEVNRLGEQQTLRGVDTSRQALKALELTGDDASARTANLAINGAIARVRNAGKSVEGYGEALAQFGDDAEFLNEITRALSSGDKATIDTAYRKLATTLKTNNEQRRNLLMELDEATGGYILSAVAGQQLSEELPRGIFRQIAAGMAGASVVTGGVTAPLLGSLVLASPRVTGEVLRALGIATGKIDALLNAFSKVKTDLKVPSIDIDTPIKNYIEKSQPGLSIRAVRIHPEDSSALTKYIDAVRLKGKEGAPDMTDADWTAAERILEKTGSDMNKPLTQLAKDAEDLLTGNRDASAITNTGREFSSASSIPKELEGLAAEAKKYKSAEEFVKGQTPIYKGGTGETSLGSFSTDIKHAQGWAERTNGRVVERYFAPDTKFAPFQEYHSKFAELKTEKATDAYYKAKGYDGVDFRNSPTMKGVSEKEVRIWNPEKLQTKSQLTDFYNKVMGKKR